MNLPGNPNCAGRNVLSGDTGQILRALPPNTPTFIQDHGQYLSTVEKKYQTFYDGWKSVCGHHRCNAKSYLLLNNNFGWKIRTWSAKACKHCGVMHCQVYLETCGDGGILVVCGLRIANEVIPAGEHFPGKGEFSFFSISTPHVGISGHPVKPRCQGHRLKLPFFLLTEDNKNQFID